MTVWVVEHWRRSAIIEPRPHDAVLVERVGYTTEREARRHYDYVVSKPNVKAYIYPLRVNDYFE